ncbi:MAG: 30S ribosomal protein S4 [Lachnospirales bacterium]
MARDRSPIVKKCRALGIDPSILGSTKKPSRRKGREGRKISEYGLQLKEKQKVKFIYGVLEAQFRNYYEKASKMKGITGDNLLKLLELRLDNVVYRLGMARTRTEARQIVRHKHILVNGKRVNIPSYQVSVGDKIEIREKSAGLERYKLILDATEGRIVPEWLESNKASLSGTVNALPTREVIDLPVHETLIIELYSK